MNSMNPTELEFRGTPLWFQAEDLDKMHDPTKIAISGRCIVGHKTGLGKTFITLAGAVRRKDRRILVVGTTKSAAVWNKEVPRWTNYKVINITRTTKGREALWKEVCKSKDVFVMIGYELLLIMIGKVKSRQKEIRKSMLPWDLVVTDESHKKLRGHKTQTFETLKCIPNKHMNILSATLLSRGPQDAFPSLHLLHPTRFSSYWAFVANHCHIFNDGFGQVIGPVKDAAYSKKILSQYYIGRGNEVRTQMEPIRQVVELDMDPDQERAYWTLVDEMLLDLGDNVVAAPNKLALNIKLRQMALCPRHFSPKLGLGVGIDYILEQMEEESHTVIFTIQKSFIAVMAEEMRKRGYHVTTIQGGMSFTEVDAAASEWKAKRGVCLCTIASAESFALDTASVAYFLGADYDPNLNIQAEGRLQRIDSANIGITIRYILIKNTVEEEVKDIINGKVRNVSRIMDSYIQKVKVERLGRTAKSI